MLDHGGIIVPASRLDEAVTFFTQALAPLGYTIVMDFRSHGSLAVGFGDPKPDFWITGHEEMPVGGVKQHCAFRCKDHEGVRKFYDAAVAAGAKDNGKPGIRTMYHEHYYGAFVWDPLGNNVEAVCHDPQ